MVCNMGHFSLSTGASSINGDVCRTYDLLMQESLTLKIHEQFLSKLYRR